ncbi:Glutamate decarboxylase 2 [Diaporthe australafricana]|uniref:Glutamate decarboxylase 2 n=1 Tax=Diaporthe australafricana TaxID=127596 RepID=A0ABR3X134_9PEZI
MSTATSLHRAQETADLVDAVKFLIVPFIAAADRAASTRATGKSDTAGVQDPQARNVLVRSYEPKALTQRLNFALPKQEGKGRAGFVEAVKDVLEYSVNTWDQGFLDKLSASTNAVWCNQSACLSDSLRLTRGCRLESPQSYYFLSSTQMSGPSCPACQSTTRSADLRTQVQVHVYKVSPVLTVVEKTTARELAALFGFEGPRAGGICCQGGSASNLTSLVTARNALFPACRTQGNRDKEFAVFTSIHGHYSVEKAARTMGLGSAAVVKVPADSTGRMDPAALRNAVAAARQAGRTPLYVNATAGTTVHGAFDPLEAVAAVCREFGVWLHVDASWGGPAVFSTIHRHKLAGSHLADSITVSPHKMLNVPLTCSMLLTDDTAVFHRANTLPADYLFHANVEGEHGNKAEGQGVMEADEVWDLADLTLQCGRRSDALKFALAWIYYGATGFERQVDHAFDMAGYLATLIQEHPNFELLSPNPPPCLQVCFYHAPGGRAGDCAAENTKRTARLAKRLIDRGFMVDYAAGDRGSFFRVVTNFQTLRTTVEGLVKALGSLGRELSHL